VKKIGITAKLLSPVVIKSDWKSEHSEGGRYITGTAVRGALATIYLQYHGQVDETFSRLFLNEDSCRFGPLDPGRKNSPLTAAACKREGREHALVDLLWYRTAQHYMAGSVPTDVGVDWRQCKKCGLDLKGHAGFWNEGTNNGLQEISDNRHHVATHVGIDRHTVTAAESILYTPESMLPSGQAEDLYGWLMADEEAFANLNRLLEIEDYRISVGQHRTRGYGDMRVTLGKAVDPEDSQAHPEHWEKWSLDLIDFLSNQPFSVPELDPEDFYFSLSFPTGAIFVDKFLRYSLDPDSMIPWLSPMSSVDDAFPVRDRPTLQPSFGGMVRWIAAITRHEHLHGWNAALGLPRQDEWGVARGSVYVYCFRGTAKEREALIQELITLSKDGVGLRRNEGFGTVIVSDDFHRRFRNQEERA
jgi:CRISPR-associated Csx10 family RAMP protein